MLDRCFFSYHPVKVEAEVKQFEVKSGDRILLFSDGLYKSMSYNTLKARLMDDKPLEDILNDYDSLCENNGDDNYTAIIMEFNNHLSFNSTHYGTLENFSEEQR